MTCSKGAAVTRTRDIILADLFDGESKGLANTFEAVVCLGFDGIVHYEHELFRTKFRWAKHRLMDALSGLSNRLPGLCQWMDQCRQGARDIYYTGLFARDDGLLPIQVVGVVRRCEAAWSFVFMVKEIVLKTGMGHDRATKSLRLDNVSVALAHHLRNSLTSVRGFTQLLKSSPQHDQDSYLEVMLYDIDKALGTIDDLMLITRSAPTHPERTDIVEVTTSVLSNSYNESSGVGVAWVESPIPTFAACYRETLERALTHIISNAVDSSAQEALVLLQTGDLDANTVYFKCTDKGSGMTLRQIFGIGDPFHSLKTDAMGLGLFIISHIVGEHDGNLEIVSGPGQGCAAFIVLPAWVDGTVA